MSRPGAGPGLPCTLESGLLTHCSGLSLPPGCVLVAVGERPGWAEVGRELSLSPTTWLTPQTT